MLEVVIVACEERLDPPAASSEEPVHSGEEVRRRVPAVQASRDRRVVAHEEAPRLVAAARLGVARVGSATGRLVANEGYLVVEGEPAVLLLDEVRVDDEEARRAALDRVVPRRHPPDRRAMRQLEARLQPPLGHRVVAGAAVAPGRDVVVAEREVDLRGGRLRERRERSVVPREPGVLRRLEPAGERVAVRGEAARVRPGLGRAGPARVDVVARDERERERARTVGLADAAGDRALLLGRIAEVGEVEDAQERARDRRRRARGGGRARSGP